MSFVTLILLSIITTSIQDCGDNNFAENCWDEPALATITCTAAKCVCENFYSEQDACTAVEASLDGKTEDHLTSKMCEELCDVSHAEGADDILKCEFFRWEKNALHCTLMNNVQCDGGWKPCNRGECVSGQTGCSGGDSPVPNDAKCAANVAFVADSVHWICYHPTDLSIHINIYGSEPVPAGVHCKTAHKCKDFAQGEDNPLGGDESNSLHVKCNAKSAAGPEEQKWIKYPGSLNDVSGYMDSNSLTLVDPPCIEKAEPIELDPVELHKPGVSFICEDLAKLEFSPDKVTVTPDNTCALLCNFHHALTLENELNEDGFGVWMKYAAGLDEGVEVNDDTVGDIKCWDSFEL